MRVIFPHIPKCAGSSIKSQMNLDNRYREDYFCHPTWHSESDIKKGKAQQQKLVQNLAKEDSWILFGHYAPLDFYKIKYDLQILLLRDPLKRAVSHYHYIKQILPDNEVTIRRHPEVRLIKDGVMDIEEFCNLNHIKHFYNRFYLRGINRDDRLVVLTMDDMKMACSSISRLIGVEIKENTRVNKSNYGSDFEYLRSIFECDLNLYKQLMNHPNKALQRTSR